MIDFVRKEANRVEKCSMTRSGKFATLVAGFGGQAGVAASKFRQRCSTRRPGCESENAEIEKTTMMIRTKSKERRGHEVEFARRGGYPAARIAQI